MTDGSTDGTPTVDATTFDVVDVLARAGDARDEFLLLLDEPAADLDAHLVSDVLRSTGRVGEALATRRTLVELCGMLRAIDAADRGLIGLDELRAGIELHAARTDRFDAFRDVRVVLRTLDEVLEPARIEHDAQATASQVRLLHRELHAWLVDELVGGDAEGDEARPDAPSTDDPRNAQHDPRAHHELATLEERRHADAIVDDLLHGARHHPVTGLLGAAWRRDWSAVPILGERLGDDPRVVAGLLDALARDLPDVSHLLQVDRHQPPRWSVDRRSITVGPRVRRAWRLPATADGLSLATIEARSRSVLTTDAVDFAIVEGVDHHALLGPIPLVERILGVPPLHAIAAFRDAVEALADEDGDPPEHLLDVATSFGRLRRRSR